MASENKRYTAPALVAVGLLLAFIAYFMTWIEVPGDIPFRIADRSLSGADFVHYLDKDCLYYIPTLMIIFAVVGFIAAMVPAFNEGSGYRWVSFIIVLTGALMIIAFAVFFMMDDTWLHGVKFADHLGAGAWLALAGGIIVTITGILRYAGLIDKGRM